MNFPLFVTILWVGTASCLPDSNEVLHSSIVSDDELEWDASFARTGRQFFVSSTKTLTLTVATTSTTLLLYKSCYAFVAGAPAVPQCRRKRDTPISDEIPLMVDEDGNLVDFKDKIVPSKAAREETETTVESEPVLNSQEFFITPIRQSRNFLTFITTSTIFYTSTISFTSIPPVAKTFKFVSGAAGDCFPATLLANAGVSAC